MRVLALPTSGKGEDGGLRRDLDVYRGFRKFEDFGTFDVLVRREDVI